MSDLIKTWKNDFRAFVNSLNLSRDDYKTMMEYIDEIPAVQPDHVADIGKKVDGDCISRQAAIDAIMSDKIDDNTLNVMIALGCGQEAKTFNGACDRHASLLNDLPSTQPEPHWIPCSERFPEYNEPVLTWDGYAFCIEKRIPYIRDDDGEPIEGDWWVGDEYDEYESECYTNLRDGAAIAWLTLPEPYRGGGKE